MLQENLYLLHSKLNLLNFNMMDHSVSAQFLVFKDCLARKMLNMPNASFDDTESALAEFVTYLATEAWSSLPIVLRTATYDEREILFKSIPDINSGQLESLNLDSISSGFTDTLVSYCIVPDDDDALKFLRKVILDYVEHTTAPPPVWSSTRTTECEICERQVPLTYHHLIPRSTHEKVLKKGWHSAAMLNSVAWLCR